MCGQCFNALQEEVCCVAILTCIVAIFYASFGVHFKSCRKIFVFLYNINIPTSPTFPSSFHFIILLFYYYFMTFRNFCLLLVVLVWSIEYVTCIYTTRKPCTPAMKEVCDKFCAQDPMSAKNARFCTVNRYHYQCIEYNSKHKYRPCEKSVTDLCSPIQPMLRCSDVSIDCHCDKKPDDGSNVLCFSNARNVISDCPPVDRS